MNSDLAVIASADRAVFFVGRTSGVSFGLVQASRALLRIIGQGDVGTLVTEQVVLPTHYYDAFARPGDSGALLRGRANKHVGLVYGGFRNDPSPSPKGQGLGRALDAPPDPLGRFIAIPSVDARGITMYTPLEVVRESMLDKLASLFVDAKLELMIPA